MRNFNKTSLRMIRMNNCRFIYWFTILLNFEYLIFAPFSWYLDKTMCNSVILFSIFTICGFNPNVTIFVWNLAFVTYGNSLFPLETFQGKPDIFTTKIQYNIRSWSSFSYLGNARYFKLHRKTFLLICKFNQFPFG